mmetsp:Transcript_9653/g.18822  ORF Transcript_9653/g.18822 Transcript_9653/m.18822 type:complete len:621 (-) Transcript_9653:2329-4191(-)
MMDESSSVIYDDEEEEGALNYKEGGYHPVSIGDLFLERYVIVQKLGWGHFSTVWLCKDLKFNTYVAMKIQKSAQNYTEAAYDEIDILLKVSKSFDNTEWLATLPRYLQGQELAQFQATGACRENCYVVQLLNSFLHYGPFGKHVCMVFEILGVNLLEVIKHYQYKGAPLPIVRTIAKQVLIGLDYLHRICGIIHTDLKPENVLVQLTQAQIHDILMHGKLTNKPLKSVETFTQIQEPVFATSAERRAWLKKQKKKEKKKKQKQRKKEQLKAAGVQPAKPTKKRKRNRKKKPKQETPPTTTQEFKVDPDDEDEELSEGEIDGELVDRSQLLASVVHKSLVQHLPPVDENIKVKIADLGNACWINRHFSTEIQTRQYRSPEVMIGVSYNATADIWSFACMIFELATGDFLFEPKGDQKLSKEEDHLAQMIELLGKFNRNFALSGLDSKKFFNKQGELRKIKQFRLWPVKSVLTEKYGFKAEEGEAFADFLLPMLVFEPTNRATAAQCMEHLWLSRPSNYDTRMSPEEYSELMGRLEQRQAELAERLQNGESISSVDSVRRYSDTDADVEDNSTLSDEASECGAEPEELQEATEYHENMRKQRERPNIAQATVSRTPAEAGGL